MSSFWKNAPLNKVISEDINIHRVDIEKVKPGKRLNIQKADDQFFITNAAGALGYAYAAFIIALIFPIIIIIAHIFLGADKVDNTAYLLSVPFLLIGLFQVLVFLYVPKKEIILDRLNGKITYPRLFFNKEHRTIQFDSLHVFHTATTSGDMLPTGTEIRIRDRRYDYQWTLESDEPLEYWSFMVWYMDKNRPLPPGTAFDAYRQKDFERRKAEGFPKPLYPTRIATPEATAQQQRERRKIGKW